MAMIVETDNYGRDYPDEKFVLFTMSEEYAHKIANLINEAAGNYCPRYWKVVENNYELQPGFEP